MGLGDNIKNLRNLKGITQKELADAIGFSYQNVSKWENGVTEPDISTLLSIANFFNVTTDTLLGRIPSVDEESFSATVNSISAMSVWTDFEYNGTFALQAKHFEGRYRGPSSRRTRMTDIGDCLHIGVNKNGRICFLHAVKGDQFHYTYWFYQRPDENDFLLKLPDASKDWYWKGQFELLVPKGGFMICCQLSDMRAYNMLRFIVPKKYHDWIDRSNPMYAYFRTVNGNRNLFANVLTRGELDNISVRLEGEGVVLSKEAEFSNPLEENIDRIIELVRQRVDISLRDINSKLSDLEARIEDLDCRVDDNESCIGEVSEELMGEIKKEIKKLLDDIN